jgi:hypothetical protein
MSRRKPFTQADISRAIKAAKSAGLKIARFEIEPTTGKIVVIAIDALLEKHTSELDKWRARRGSR